MQTIPQATRAELPSAPKLLTVFAILFVAYQLPEGLGARMLHSLPVQATLMIMFLPIAWLCGRMLGYRGLDAWYMARTPGWAALLGACFALAVLAKAAALWIGTQAGVYSFAMTQTTTAAIVQAMLVAVPFTVFSSVAEDILTRGFLMRAAPGLSTRWIFIAASSCLYVLNHIYRLSNGPLEWLMLFCFGLAYAAALFYSRTLWAAIGLHWGWNYAGHFTDRVASVDAIVPGRGSLVSSLAHLAMLAVVVLAAQRFRRRNGGR
jgi:membrane protease YdiL (CAAX protease family)